MKKKRTKIFLTVSILSVLTFLCLIVQKDSDAIYTFEENGVMYALYVNGESVNEFPTFEGLYDYGVTVSCSNANGYWDYEESLLRIEDIEENAGCDIYFNDPYYMTISDYIVSSVGNGGLFYEDGTTATYTPFKLMEESDFASIENTATYPWSYDEETKIWTSTNVNVTNTSGITFTIEESGSLEITSSLTGTTNSSSYYSSYLYVYQNGTLMYSDYYTYGSTEVLEVSAGDEIYITYKQYSSSYSGVAAIEFRFYMDEVEVTPGYRYEGANPNNYVWFNGELWRIIGAMDTLTADGEVEMLTKLIATDSIGGWAWDAYGGESSSYTNYWPTSTLYSVLNIAYYNSIDGTGETYCKKYGSSTSTLISGNCDFTTTWISEDYKEMVENVLWSLGKVSTSNLTVDEFFEAEMVSTTSSNDGFIGLMYLSDYGYSHSIKTVLSTYVYAYSSWLYSGNCVWTLTQGSYSSQYGTYISLWGNVVYQSSYTASAAAHIYASYNVIPVLYLKSSVEVVSGDGTASNPYILVEGES